MTFNQTSDDHEDYQSKSAIKRESERLKQVGEQLLHLSDEQLSSMPMPDDLTQAIAEAKRIKSREGLRRQKQYIGKLLRQFDTDTLEQRLNHIENAKTLNTRQFHDLEQLREQLIQGDNNSIGEVIARFPSIDTQKLRQLVRNARKEQQQALQNPSIGSQHARKLFRFLREASEIG